MAELLTPDEMGQADRLAIERGPLTGCQLMLNAGRAVAAEILAAYPASARFAVLAGPGNNGGDGYVVAELLAKAGAKVDLFALAEPRPGSDADLARRDCSVDVRPLGEFAPDPSDVVVDGLFGAGLDRAVSGVALEAIERVKKAGSAVVAIDLPSGLSGASGAILGDAFEAALTVTFFRKKPGHLLYPGRQLCGRVVVTDIGIPQDVLSELGVTLFENMPDLWRGDLPSHIAGIHKYARGAVGVFSGGVSSTGAARLSAMAAARSGAGAVTVLSPPSAILVNASHLTSVMLASIEGLEDLTAFLATGKTASLVIGPGFGTGNRLRDFTLAILSPDISEDACGRGVKSVVLDADALTQFSTDPESLFDAIAGARQTVIMTPHEAEFARVFPEIANAGNSKVERVRAAAKSSGAVVLLKGPDTVIASPDGRCAINTNGNINLATAGSGDVLSGIIAALTAQGMAAWPAACAAAWLHAEAGRAAGFGAMSEDLAKQVSVVLGKILDKG